MSAGNQPNLGGLNSQAGAIVVSLRNDFQAVANFNDYISSAGGVTFLEGLGMSPADAAVMVSTFANLANLNAAYNGGSAPTLNYKENSNLLWGGQ